jgi:signal transduction histidine kinase/DNA-binding LytR/AlgR family response regulator
MKKSQRERPRRFALGKSSRQEKRSAGSHDDCPATVPKKTILIVDDRLINRRLLLAMLIHLGHRLLEADTGVKALQIVRKEKPDLIIADILMPEMHGYEFVRKLRGDRKIADTPVVFFTARYLEEESRKLAKVCGVHHLIVKPVRWEEVDRIVNEALGTRPHAGRPLRAGDLARKHLDLITGKLADKVSELEELNIRLEIEMAERKRVLEQLQLAHEEANWAREDAERANRAKDSFLANLSHELRTPLTPVLMCVAALEQESAIQPEFRQQLAMMRRNIELEARLIDDLLDLTGIAHGKIQLVRSGPVDIHSLLAHTEQIVESDARQKSIHLEFDLTASEHHVDGEAARLHQVFWNLIKNSIKFTPRGGRVTVRTFNPVPGQFVLMVEDTGAGITPQALPVIFRAFEQGEAREAQAPGGLGLGLAISQAIIELHGGTIRGESAGPGLGSIFTVELVTVLPFPGAETSEAKKSQQSRSSGRRLRLLVVEDHEPTMEVLARLLRSHGHEVLTACTVRVALLLASTHSFDLVISDLGLPDGSGLDLMRQLTKEYGLRGIALSGYGMPEDRFNTQQAGFLAHLVKPVNFEQLHDVLQQIATAAESTAISEASG